MDGGGDREEHWAREDGSLDHVKYMESKRRRQGLQKEQRTRYTRRGSWFRGVVVFINGYTSIRTSLELETLVLEGGGDVGAGD